MKIGPSGHNSADTEETWLEQARLCGNKLVAAYHDSVWPLLCALQKDNALRTFIIHAGQNQMPLYNNYTQKKKIFGFRFSRPETGFTCCSSPSIDLFSRYRAGFWHDWVWGVEVWPMGLQGLAVRDHFTIWVWVLTHYALTDTPVLPTLHAFSTSHSSSSGAAWGGGEGGGIKLSTAQADKEEGSGGITPHQRGCSAAAWF